MLGGLIEILRHARRISEPQANRLEEVMELEGKTEAEVLLSSGLCSKQDLEYAKRMQLERHPASAFVDELREAVRGLSRIATGDLQRRKA